MLTAQDAAISGRFCSGTTREHDHLEATEIAPYSGNKLTTWRSIISRDPDWPFVTENTPAVWPGEQEGAI